MLPTAFVITGYVTSNAVLPKVIDRVSQLPMLSDVWLQQSDRAQIILPGNVSVTGKVDRLGAVAQAPAGHNQEAAAACER